MNSKDDKKHGSPGSGNPQDWNNREMKFSKAGEMSVQCYTPETMPEWAVGYEGIEMLLDGVTFHISMDAQAKRRGVKMRRVEMKIDPANFNNGQHPDDVHKTLEIVCGCIVAYLGAMAHNLGHEEFSRLIAPLPEVIGMALAQVGIIKEIDDSQLNGVKHDLEKRAQEHPKFKELLDMANNAKLKGNGKGKKHSEADLKKAINSLKKMISE